MSGHNIVRSTAQTQEALGLQSWQAHPARMAASHRHNDLELNLVERGTATYFFGGRRLVLSSGMLALFWAVSPHQLVECDENAHLHWLTLPLAWFLHIQWPEPFQRAVLNCDPITDRLNLSQDPLLFRQWQRDLEADSPEHRTIILLEVEARLRRLAAEWVPARPSQHAPPSRVQTQAEKIAAYLAAHFQEEVNIETVASQVGLHPNYAMTAFRQAYGQTIVEYLTQCRVAHAQQMLVTTGQKVVTIALQSGFGSVSQFYTAFKRLCGMAPRAYRESLR